MSNSNSNCCICGESTPVNTPVCNTPVCKNCAIFKNSRPCNICFYILDSNFYSTENWNNIKRVCNICLKDNKHCRI